MTRPRILVQVSRLDLDADDLGRRQGLTPADLHRAAAIRHPRARAGFLAARHSLRAHLAARLGCRPEEVPLRVDSGGKPHLAGCGPSFSVARSQDWCAIAISDDCPVGVDVEVIRPVADVDAVVDHLFPPLGRAELRAASPADRPAVFLRWWTRIEAAVKACGVGLDAAAACLVRAPQETCDGLSGLALSAAGAVEGASPEVEWRSPLTAVSTIAVPARTRLRHEGV
jgi:phosphopantetheinyl transferase